MCLLFTRPYLTEKQILEGVQNGSIFGVIECDLHVPDNLRDRFKDFQPIIKSANVTIDDIGDHMKSYCKDKGLMKTPRKTLLGSYFATNHLIATDLLQWYLNEGIVVTKVHLIAQYHRSKCFERFGNQVMHARRSADNDPSQKIQADGFKLIGNSAFGKTIINKERFTNINYIDGNDVVKVSESINSKLFRDMDYIGEDMVEIEHYKRSITIDSNIIIGFMILERSKLILLRFVHYFLHKYLNRKSYCLLACDTDSMYLSIAAEDIFPSVKPELRSQFREEYPQWFALTYCDNHRADFFDSVFSGKNWQTNTCTECQKAEMYWKREVGLFHVEFKGTAFAGLSPKSYYCVGEKDKCSAKGVSKRLNNIGFEDFKTVLLSKSSHTITNKGFRVKSNAMHTYAQKKVGLSYLYIKRKVADNGIDTLPTDV